MMRPSLGRIVLFCERASPDVCEWPAIVTGVHEMHVDLQVFRTTDIRAAGIVPFNDGDVPGAMTWRWPPRA